MLFLVTLTNSVGGFEKLAPDSSLNDGMFDLIILKKPISRSLSESRAWRSEAIILTISTLFTQKRTV
ncbi:hypothetical protein QNN00_26025 [Bacillus velezensis]|nr:hypothetical protein [Bacillus velezensis]